MLFRSDKVLEVGCGEGGNLLPFAKAGCRVMGVDIDAMRIEQARAFFATGVPPNIYAFHRYTRNSAYPSDTLA